jgi:hypothetical protein
MAADKPLPLTRDQVALVTEHIKLAEYIAWRFRVKAREHRVDLDDLKQESNLALINAARTWVPERGTNVVFATHAGLWIRGALKRLLSRKPMPTLSEFAAIADRRFAQPILEPLFPITSFGPSSDCPHRSPIEDGSVFVCMVCFDCGERDHPALKRDPRKDPQPEPIPKAPPIRPKRETRRQRRARIFHAGTQQSARTA